jgi:hypothetical protein
MLPSRVTASVQAWTVSLFSIGLLFQFGVFAPLAAQPAQTGTLVKIACLRNTNRKVGLGLFKNTGGLPEDDSRMAARLTVEFEVFDKFAVAILVKTNGHGIRITGDIAKNGVPGRDLQFDQIVEIRFMLSLAECRQENLERT